MTYVMDFQVLIPYRADNGPRDEIFSWVKQRWFDLFGVHPIVADSDPAKEFNRAEARNNAFKQSRTTGLVFADADVIPQRLPVLKALDWASLGYPTLAYEEDRYYNLAEEFSKVILSVKPSAEINEPRFESAWEFKITSWAGMYAMTHQQYLDCHGHDERFMGWGWEDSAFKTVVESLYGDFHRVDAWLGHIWHPYTKESTWDNPHAQTNRILFQEYERNKHNMIQYLDTL